MSECPTIAVEQPINVVVFGETGAGKSSLINMLMRSDKATTSNDAVGCTTNSESYDITIRGTFFRIWDTPGLNESTKGTVPGSTAIDELGRLFERLNSEQGGGLHLLLYCVVGYGFRSIMRVNYDLVWGIMCQMQIPLVFVVTKQDNLNPEGNGWWDLHQHHFIYRYPKDEHDLIQKTVSVTTIKGKDDLLAAQYSQSTDIMEEVLLAAVPNSKFMAGRIEQNWFSSGHAKRMTKKYADILQKQTGDERNVLDSIRQRLSQQHGQELGSPLRNVRARGLSSYLKSLLCLK